MDTTVNFVDFLPDLMMHSKYISEKGTNNITFSEAIYNSHSSIFITISINLILITEPYRIFESRTSAFLDTSSPSHFKCTICSKEAGHKMQMMKHVENQHLKTDDNSYGYCCPYCSHFAFSYNGLGYHFRRFHKAI